MIKVGLTSSVLTLQLTLVKEISNLSILILNLLAKDLGFWPIRYFYIRGAKADKSRAN